MDKRGKEFSKYHLGCSVIHDIPNNAHGTFWNADAEAKVRSDPQRFEFGRAFTIEVKKRHCREL